MTSSPLTPSVADDPIDEQLERLAPPPSDLDDRLLDSRTLGALFGGPQTEVRVGRYVIIDRIGRGAAGVVYEAYDPALDRSVALKAVTMSAVTRGAELERIRHEAPLLAQLAHPNIVPIYDVFEAKDALYVVMERIDGDDLCRWLETPGRAWPEVLGVFEQVARGLIAAHDVGIVHRDVKPANIRIGTDGRVRVVDFGLAKALPLTYTREDSPTSEDEACPRAMLASAALGTPAYAAPEQATATQTSPAADQYSFCVSLFEALYGRFPPGPHGPSSAVSSAAGVPSVPRWLASAIAQGLSTDPRARFSSMRALARALEPRRRRRRRGSSAALAVAVAATAAVVGWGGLRVDECTTPVGTGTAFWTPARRDAVGAALLASNHEHAASTSARVQTAFDDYVERWGAAYRTSCADARSAGGSASPSIVCLDRAHVALEQAVELLQRSDTSIADRALTLVHRLPSLDRCRERGVSPGSSVATEPPAELDPPVAEARARLARAQTLRHAGQLDEGLAVALAALRDARELAYGPLIADAEAVVGTLHRRVGRYHDALRFLKASYFTAVDVEYLDRAIESALELTELYSTTNRSEDDPRTWLRRSQTLIERAGRDPRKTARATIMSARIARGDEQIPRAIDRITEVITDLETRRDADNLDIADALDALASLLNTGGDHAPAVAAARRAVERSTRILGRRHPRSSRYLVTLARTLHNGGFQAEALEIIDGVIDMGEMNDRYVLTFAYVTQASIHGWRLDYEAMYRSAEEADRLLVHTVGEDHPVRIEVLTFLARSLDELGRPDEAIDAARRALALQHRSDPDFRLLSAAHTTMSHVLQHAGHHERAMHHIDTAVELAEAALGPNDAELLFELNLRGVIRREYGDLDGAVSDCKRALTLARSDPGRRYELHIPRLMGLLSYVYRDLGRIDDAINTLEQGLRLMELGHDTARIKARLYFDLAQLRWEQRRDRSQALARARQAEAYAVESGAVGEELAAEIRTWIRARTRRSRPR